MGDRYGYLGGSERQSDMTQMGEGRGKNSSAYGLWLAVVCACSPGSAFGGVVGLLLVIGS
jgi:hypothetical protein